MKKTLLLFSLLGCLLAGGAVVGQTIMVRFSAFTTKANRGLRTLFRSTLWLLALLPLSLWAQTFDVGKNTYAFSGAVNAVVTDNAGNTYIGGNFGTVGLWSGHGAKFSSTGTWDNTTLRVAGGSISAVVAIPTALGGGWYIGGEFTKINGQTRNRLARINADGSLHAFDPNMDYEVSALALNSSGELYVGGRFTTVGGSTTRNKLCKFNSSGTLDAFDPDIDANPNAIVYALALNSSGDLYVGGRFTTVGGFDIRNNLCKFNSSGTLDDFDPDISELFGLASVRSLALNSSGDLYVGGRFTTVGGFETRNNLCKFNSSGTLDDFDPNMNNSVSALALNSSGELYVGGEFTTVAGSTARNRLCKFNSSGTLNDFNPNMNFAVSALALNSSGELYVGGTFTTVGGSTTRNNLCKFNSSGTLDAFDPNMGGVGNPVVLALALNSSGELYVGGTFTTVGGSTTRRGLCKFNSSGTLDAFDPNMNNSVRALALTSSGDLYVGGDFTTVGGSTPRNRLCKFNSSGTLDAFNPNISSTSGGGTFVHALALNSSGELYVGGRFTTVGGSTTRNNLCKFNSSGTLDDFNPNISSTSGGGTVLALALNSSGELYVGGEFTTVAGSTARNRLCKFNSSGTLNDFNPNMNNSVHALALTSSGELYAGGGFTTVGGSTPRRGLCKFNSSGMLDVFDPNIIYTIANLAVVYALALNSSGDLYVGGSFATVGGTTRNRLCKFNSSGTLDAFDPGVSSAFSFTAVLALALNSSGELLVGGEYTAPSPYFSVYTGAGTPAGGCVTPIAYNITGGGAYCEGGTGVTVGLSNSETGVNYQLYKDASIDGTALSGTGSALSWANKTAGTYTVVATRTTGGCTATMSGSVVVTAVQNPTAASAGNDQTGAATCGLTSVTLAANTPTVGTGAWSVISGAGGTVTTPGSPTSTFSGTAGATYTLRWTVSNSPCTASTDDVVITFNQNPTAGITGATTGCGSVTLTATGGTSYAWSGGNSTSTAMNTFNTSGTYTVTVTNSAGCTTSTSATVTVNSVPTAYNVTGTGSYCAGSTGVAVGLAGSETGVTYQLMNGASTVGTGVNGTGSAISFGNQTTATYTVVATRTTGGCTANMMGSAVVTVHTPVTKTWVGTTNNWNTASNWNPSGVPYECDNVIISSSSQVPVISTTVSRTAATTINQGRSISISAGGTFNNTGAITVNGLIDISGTSGTGTLNNNSPGTITVNGVDASRGDGYLLVRMSSSGIGTLNNNSGATITLNNYAYLEISPNNTVTNAGTINNNSNCLLWVKGGLSGAGGINNSSGAITGNGGVISGSLYTNPVGSTIHLTYDQMGEYNCLSFNNGLTNAGNILFQIGGTTPCTEYDKITVTGTATLGGTFSAQLINGYNPPLNTTFDVITATAISGTFTNNSINLGGGKYANMYYTATKATIKIENSAPVSCTNPTAYNVTGGGSYCSGGTGVAVGLDNSETGVMYQLFNGASTAGMPVSGSTGSTITFGNQTAAGTYTVVATRTTGGCTATMSGSAVVTAVQNPTAASAGTDQTGAATCGLTSVTLAANTPTVGTGAWSVISGAGGTVTTPGSPTSTFSGTAGTTYTLRWTVSNSPCTASTDDVIITFNQNPPTADNTTSAAAICEGTAKALTGTPAGGTWSIVGAATGTISGSTYSTGNISANENVTIRYTIAANGACAATTEDVTFTVNANPGAADNTTSNAAICEGTDKALTGTPTGGTWSIVGAATGTISGSNYSTGNVAANENVTVRYTIAANGACAATTEDVTFTVNANPGAADNTTSNAAICEGTDKALTGTPAGGTWSIVGAATGTISGSNYSTGDVAANENVTVRYTVAANGACAATTEDVTFTVNANPGAADNTTSNAAICEGTDKALTGTPAGGTWGIFGAATGTISGSNYSTGDVAANENVTIRYTIAANGACAATTEDVTFTVNASPGTADNTTSAAAICEGTDKALTGTPAGGTWSIFGAATGTISGTNYSTGNVAANENVTVRYTVAANGACAATTEDVTFTVNANPGAADNTTSNAAICEGTAKALTGTPAGGTWSIVGAATGTISGTTYGTGDVTANENVTIRYTIAANGACAATTEDVTFTVNANPGAADNTTANAAICEGTDKALTGTPAGGTWSIVGAATGTISGTNYSTGDISANENVTVRYTIAAAGTCAATTEDVTFTVNANPGTADNTTSTAAICEGTGKALTGTPTGGTWSIVGAATGTISGTTYSTGDISANENVTIRYTIAANGACAATTEDVTFTVNVSPGTADNTTSNAAICEGTGKALTGTPAGGTWSIVGPATGTISGTNYSTGDISANENVTIRYTIAATGACAATTEDVTFTVNANPGAADNTTSDAAICEGTDKALTGTPAGGTWSIFGAATGSISGSNYSTGDVAANENVTIRYTVAANGACAATTEDVTFTVNANPGTADNTTSNAAICEGTGKALTGTPAGGTWSVIGAATGTISGTTYGTGDVAANENVTIRYTVAANGACPATTEDVTFTVNANPGAADNTTSAAAICEGTDKALTGTPAGGTWSIFGAATGTISGTNYSTGDVAANENVTIRYTVAANGACAATTEDVTFTVNANPTTANAGTDQTNAATCGQTSLTLAANTPTVGTGVWSIISGAGGSVTTPSSPTSTFSGTAGTTYTLRWTVTNAPCAASTDDVVITFNQNPMFSTCPPGVTVNASSGCAVAATYTATAAGTTPTGTIGYTFSGVTTGSGSGSGSGLAFNLGTTLVTLTATSTCGTSTCSFNVVVQAGEINIQGNNVDIADGDNTPAVADHTDFGQTISGSVVRTFTVQNTAGNAPLGIASIGLSGTNANQFSVGALSPASPVQPGQSATFTVTYAPNATGVHNATVVVTSGDCDEGTYDFAIRGELTCSPPAITTFPSSNGSICPGTTLNLSVGASGTAPLAYAWAGTGTFAGGNTATPTVTGAATGTYTVTITNGCGSATGTVAVTVADTQLPSITCPGNIIRNSDANTCGAVVTYAPATATDNCGTPTVAQASGPLVSGSIFPVGVSSVTFRATDAATNSTDCVFTVTVTDTQVPNIICPGNLTRNTDANACTASVTYNNATATDNCTLPTGQPAWVSGGTGTVQGASTTTATFAKANTTVTWRATDAAGLTKTCTFRVIVNDNEAPTLTCPPPINLNAAPNGCTAVATYTAPPFTDNCAPTNGVSVRTNGLPSGSAFPVGTSNVVFRATDAAGKTSTCSLRVIVTDAQLPSITCPDPVTVTGSGTPCQATVFYASATASDNCDGPLAPFLASGLGSGSNFPVGTTTNTWRAVTSNGQTSECSFTVTVNCPPTRPSPGAEDRAAFAPSLWVAPNPASTEVAVSVQSAPDVPGTLSVYDATGRLVWERAQVGAPALRLDVSQWPDGVYVVSWRQGGTTLAKRLAVVKGF